jgi:hypothetical protein
VTFFICPNAEILVIKALQENDYDPKTTVVPTLILKTLKNNQIERLLVAIIVFFEWIYFLALF